MRLPSGDPGWVERLVTIFIGTVVLVLLIGVVCLGFLLWHAIGADPFRSSREQTGPVSTGHGLASSFLDPARPACKLSRGVDLPRRAS